MTPNLRVGGGCFCRHAPAATVAAAALLVAAILSLLPCASQAKSLNWAGHVTNFEKPYNWVNSIMPPTTTTTSAGNNNNATGELFPKATLLGSASKPVAAYVTGLALVGRRLQLQETGRLVLDPKQENGVVRIVLDETQTGPAAQYVGGQYKTQQTDFACHENWVDDAGNQASLPPCEEDKAVIPEAMGVSSWTGQPTQHVKALQLGDNSVDSAQNYLVPGSPNAGVVTADKRALFMFDSNVIVDRSSKCYTHSSVSACDCHTSCPDVATQVKQDAERRERAQLIASTADDWLQQDRSVRVETSFPAFQLSASSSSFVSDIYQSLNPNPNQNSNSNSPPQLTQDDFTQAYRGLLLKWLSSYYSTPVDDLELTFDDATGSYRLVFDVTAQRKYFVEPGMLTEDMAGAPQPPYHGRLDQMLPGLLAGWSGEILRSKLIDQGLPYFFDHLCLDLFGNSLSTADLQLRCGYYTDYVKWAFETYGYATIQAFFLDGGDNAPSPKDLQIAWEMLGQQQVIERSGFDFDAAWERIEDIRDPDNSGLKVGARLARRFFAMAFEQYQGLWGLVDKTRTMGVELPVGDEAGGKPGGWSQDLLQTDRGADILVALLNQPLPPIGTAELATLTIWDQEVMVDGTRWTRGEVGSACNAELDYCRRLSAYIGWVYTTFGHKVLYALPRYLADSNLVATGKHDEIDYIGLAYKINEDLGGRSREITRDDDTGTLAYFRDFMSSNNWLNQDFDFLLGLIQVNIAALEGYQGGSGPALPPTLLRRRDSGAILIAPSNGRPAADFSLFVQPRNKDKFADIVVSVLRGLYPGVADVDIELVLTDVINTDGRLVDDRIIEGLRLHFSYEYVAQCPAGARSPIDCTATSAAGGSSGPGNGAKMSADQLASIISLINMAMNTFDLQSSHACVSLMDRSWDRDCLVRVTKEQYLPCFNGDLPAASKKSVCSDAALAFISGITECGAAGRDSQGKCVDPNDATFTYSASAIVNEVVRMVDAESANNAAAASGGGDGDGGASDFPVVAVGAGAGAGFLLIVIIIIVIVTRKNKGGGGGMAHPKEGSRSVVAFENPMYDDPGVTGAGGGVVGAGAGGVPAGDEGLYDEPAFNSGGGDKSNPLYASNEDLAMAGNEEEAPEDTGYLDVEEGGYLDVSPEEPSSTAELEPHSDTVDLQESGIIAGGVLDRSSSEESEGEEEPGDE